MLLSRGILTLPAWGVCVLCVAGWVHKSSSNCEVWCNPKGLCLACEPLERRAMSVLTPLPHSVPGMWWVLSKYFGVNGWLNE